MSNTDTRWEQALLNKVTSNGERIAIIERDIGEIKKDIPNLNNKVSSLDNKVSSLDNRLSNVEKIIDDVRKILKWITGGIGAIILSLIANLLYANFS
jgi:peptidoglycan hydrolase CwlO-like protein